jgi:hypothetical protein
VYRQNLGLTYSIKLKDFQGQEDVLSKFHAAATSVLKWVIQSWDLKTLKEEHRIRMFENGMLRKMFGPKREEVTGGWRTLHNEGIVYTTHRELYG